MNVLNHKRRDAVRVICVWDISGIYGLQNDYNLDIYKPIKRFIVRDLCETIETAVKVMCSWVITDNFGLQYD